MTKLLVTRSVLELAPPRCSGQVAHVCGSLVCMMLRLFMPMFFSALTLAVGFQAPLRVLFRGTSTIVWITVSDFLAVHDLVVQSLPEVRGKQSSHLIDLSQDGALCHVAA